MCDYSSHDQQPSGHLSSYRVNVSNLCHVCVEFVKTVSKYKQICRIIRTQLFKKKAYVMVLYETGYVSVLTKLTKYTKSNAEIILSLDASFYTA